MKIYEIVLLQDLHNSYSGLDDIETNVFTSEASAKNELLKSFDKALVELGEDDTIEMDSDYNNETRDLTYYDLSSDTGDYFKGEIRTFEI